ncbi:CrcB family protein [Pseudarthrobacter sp. J75]|uniref:fluoride efflux transporter FluC n=1 Tax=unclassified Pseudarthrobacter TaxID=2647000 RepID=UPI002E81087D|nr:MULTISPECIES: CrcB family protein [unclassified Pseudarthrobacter]MEE2521419.1 CrcB family protein [Pseudarthrobacter sp. J47]MEE2528651.1 CrcB family protein [Pseudarthrobacter sp. J75]
MTAALLVGAFGMLGALLRFGVDTWFAHHTPGPVPVPRNLPQGRSTTVHRHWPWATLLVNVAGCAMIGMALGATAGIPPGQWQTGLAAGLAGGLTTFSSWTTATVRLFSEARYAAAAMNVVANLVLGLSAAAAGMALVG